MIHRSIKQILGIFFFALFSSAFAYAAGPNTCQVIRGQMINDGPFFDLRLKTDALEVYKINGHPSLMANLRKLKTGDFIVATGDLTATTANLDSLQTVGLQELLGLWRSSRWELFEFQDFSRLNLYLTRGDTQSDFSFSRIHELAYAVTPENNSDYSIFISDNLKKVMAGSLHISGTGADEILTLTLLDPATGQVAEKISLSPLVLK